MSKHLRHVVLVVKTEQRISAPLLYACIEVKNLMEFPDRTDTGPRGGGGWLAGASLLRRILSLRLLLLSPLISKDGQQLSIAYGTAWGYEHEGQSWSSSRRMKEDFLFFS